MTDKQAGLLIIIACIAIWGGCIAIAGTAGIIFGWMPAWVLLFILMKLDEGM